ncbi:MAG TPA: acyltransferase [Methylophilaceae bacterium]|nr:acyltransferase [Methylophilaceae bacterium]
MNNTQNQNNFGLLRLSLAILVILSHSFELIDGNKSREILTKLFDSISFGEFAVDGFFLVSGYLVFKSYFHSSSLVKYLAKRLLRIYPAFIGASIISILFFATLSAGIKVIDWSLVGFTSYLQKMLLLVQPIIVGVFPDNHYKLLNGALWSIQYEFICYLVLPFVAILSSNQRNVIFTFTCLLTISFTAIKLTLFKYYIYHDPVFISVGEIARLTTGFFIGGSYYLYKDKINWCQRYSVISLIALIAFLLTPLLAHLGVFIFGGYLIFNFAINYKNKFYNQIGSKNDISYGVYLYAWPIQSLIIQYLPSISPVLLFSLSVLFSCLFAYLSWKLIEEPLMMFKMKMINT